MSSCNNNRCWCHKTIEYEDFLVNKSGDIYHLFSQDQDPGKWFSYEFLESSIRITEYTAKKSYEENQLVHCQYDLDMRSFSMPQARYVNNGINEPVLHKGSENTDSKKKAPKVRQRKFNYKEFKKTFYDSL